MKEIWFQQLMIQTTQSGSYGNFFWVVVMPLIIKNNCNYLIVDPESGDDASPQRCRPCFFLPFLWAWTLIRTTSPLT
jgi:hypothetical protein